jgi:hypothetical protein
MAEREGFEPSVPVYRYGSLAGNWFQPLTHLSAESAYITLTFWEIKALIFNYVE